MSTRGLVRIGVVSALVALALGAFVTADAGARGRAPRRDGRIFVLPEAVDPDQELDGPTIEGLLRTAQTHVTHGDNGAWRVYFIAFLSRAVSAPQVFAVFHRLPREANAEPASVTALNLADPQQRVLATQVVLTQAEGYEAGQHVLLTLARMVGGREQVYARTEIELR